MGLFPVRLRLRQVPEIVWRDTGEAEYATPSVGTEEDVCGPY